MAAVLTSFAQLAAVFGHDTATRIHAKADYRAIERKLGTEAAVLWAYMQDNEARGVYGPKGQIIHTVESLAGVTGYSSESVIRALIDLIHAGHARYNPNQTVKAA